jgi:hypothetical protein
VKRGWNLCGRVRERGAFSVWGDIARKGCHFDGEVSMPTGGSVKAVRTTGEHVASVGGSYGCGEGGERRAVLCECFPVDFRPFVLFSDFFTQNLYGQKISFAFQMLIFEVHGFVLGWIISVFRFFVVSPNFFSYFTFR